MKVLVTGANGMLGSDLCPYLENIGCMVIPTSSETMDITDSKQVEDVIVRVRPDLIIHCAAYTNVDKAESDLESATKVNAEGTKNIAISAQKINATLIYISTDYVFDGTKETPYLPTDIPNPINNYGLTKYQGELEVTKNCEKHFIIRTSWLYGNKGKNFVETMISLSNEKELKVVDDQIGCPTWTLELIQGILKTLNKPYGTYHICSSDSTTWYDFAVEIFKQMELKTNIKPCTTNEFPRPAKRPKYSALENNNTLRNWKDALKDYLAYRKENQ